MKRTDSLRLIAAVLLGASLTGCSTQAKKVDCDGTLRPINRPAAQAAAVTSKEPESSNGKSRDEK